MISMITFSYSLLWDIKWSIRNNKNKVFLNSIKVVVFPFKINNIFTVYKALKSAKRYNFSKDIKVYFLTSGTTGAYTYPNKIFICPVEIHKFGGLERVLSHELAHLELGSEVEKLTHQEKEKRVHEIEISIKNLLLNNKQ